MAGPAPINVAVVNYSATQQKVSWFPRQGGATAYSQIQVSVNGGSYTNIAINGKVIFSASISTVYISCTAGQSRRYRVRHYNSAYVEYSDWAYSSTLVFQPPGGGGVPSDPEPPDDPAPVWAPPQNLRITSLADTSISLTWTLPRSYQALYANVFRNSGDITGQISLAANATSLTDNTYPRKHAIMAYHIVGQIAPGDLAYSSGATIRTTPDPPPAIYVERQGLGIKVTWTRPTWWDYVWQWLDLQRWDNVGGVWASLMTGLPETATSHEDYDIIRGRQYRYRVRARANAGSFERVSAWTYSGFIRLISLSVNVGGSWKAVDGIGDNVGGVWKDFAGAWVNVGGVWIPA